MAKSFDVSKFRKDLTKSITGMSRASECDTQVQ
jgi:hypothetical protein